MALGDGGPVNVGGTGTPDPVTGDGATGQSGAVSARLAQQWLLTLLPTFPLLLLVLRLWHLSRQDLSTMLLLVQYVNPIGLLSALVITLVWALPLAVLAVGYLGTLLWLSAPHRFDPDRSLLARVTARTPGWVYDGAVLLAALTWQLRFLPALAMLALALLGLRTRRRYPGDTARIRLACLVVPVTAAVLAYLWLLPAITAAGRAGELVTVLLLLLPPGLAVLLTGPVPARVAPAMTNGLLIVAALTAPFLLGTIFLRAPVLPAVAVELTADAAQGSDPTRSAVTASGGTGPASQQPQAVLLGRVITVDDRVTTLLDDEGVVHFVPNDHVRSQALCPDPGRVPYSEVSVHGWPVEETALEWLMPRREPVDQDPRCGGRPLPPAGQRDGPVPVDQPASPSSAGPPDTPRSPSPEVADE